MRAVTGCVSAIARQTSRWAPELSGYRCSSVCFCMLADWGTVGCGNAFTAVTGVHRGQQLAPGHGSSSVACTICGGCACSSASRVAGSLGHEGQRAVLATALTAPAKQRAGLVATTLTYPCTLGSAALGELYLFPRRFCDARLDV